MCAGCRATLRRVARGEPTRSRPDPEPPGMPPTWALTPYEQVVRRIVVAHKDNGRVALRAELSRLWRVALAGALAADAGLRRAALSPPLLVVPAPSSPASIRARGRDPWREVVTEALADEPRLCLLRPLVLRRRVRDQAGLDAADRAANLAGAMTVRRPIDLTGRALVIADDVVTTGVTLAEAARALRAAGAADVRAVVIAATARRAR